MIVECLLLSFSLLLAQSRTCRFHVKPHNRRYYDHGFVNGSEQYCEESDCCVGFFMINADVLEVDTLGCGWRQKQCPERRCWRIHNVLECICNDDLCNSNFSWTPAASQEPPSLSLGHSLMAALLVVALVLCFAASATIRCFPKDQRESAHSSLQNPLKASNIITSEIQPLNILHKGIFATVCEARYQNHRVVLKNFPKSWRHQFAAERAVFQLPLMSHPGIVHFLGAVSMETYNLLVLQHATHGSLHSYLCSHSSSWRSSRLLCLSLSQGLLFLHSELHKEGVCKPAVAHKDLSSSNVLVKADGTCAICDFGCSSVLRSGQNRSRQTEVQSPMGALRYMSPEVLEGSVNLNSDWSLQADVYSLGLVLWEIWMRCSDLFGGGAVPLHLLPYEQELGPTVSLEQLRQYVSLMNQRPSLPDAWGQHLQSIELQDLLSSCWDSDADARPSAACIANRLSLFTL